MDELYCFACRTAVVIEAERGIIFQVGQAAGCLQRAPISRILPREAMPADGIALP